MNCAAQSRAPLAISSSRTTISHIKMRLTRYAPCCTSSSCRGPAFLSALLSRSTLFGASLSRLVHCGISLRKFLQTQKLVKSFVSVDPSVTWPPGHVSDHRTLVSLQLVAYPVIYQASSFQQVMTPRLLPQTSLTGNLILVYKSLYFRSRSAILHGKTGSKAQESVENSLRSVDLAKNFQRSPQPPTNGPDYPQPLSQTFRVSHRYTRRITYFGLKKPSSLTAERAQEFRIPPSQKHHENPYQVGCNAGLTASSTTKIPKPCLRISETIDPKSHRLFMLRTA